MKKVLIYSFLLAISSLSYSSLESSSAEDATMKVTATIIKPLTVQSNGPLDFGRILPGVQNANAFSSFTIKGEENSKVKITFENLPSDGSSFTTPIYNRNNRDYFDVTFNCTTPDEPGKFLNHTNNTITLNGAGENLLRIAATADTRPDQAPGQYVGQIRMRATYE